MLSADDRVLSPGATVLVTGVSGFLGSHVADQLLAAGYHVRGTTRDPVKASWMSTLFAKKYEEKIFELVDVPDMAQPGVFDDAMKGVSGVIHTASDMSFRPDPNQVIPPMIAGTLNLLNAAESHADVHRFVLTSSCAAAASPGVARTIDGDTWNKDACEAAWAPPPYDPERGFAVYAASKMESEWEAWKWYAEKKPSFTLNSVLPAMLFGRSIDAASQALPSASTSQLIPALYNNNVDAVSNAFQYFFINVEDCALLHVAALVHPSITDERIFAYSAPYTWRRAQDIMRRLYQDRTFSPEVPEAELDGSTIVPVPQAEAWLRDMGQDGWTSFEDCIRKSVEGLV